MNLNELRDKAYQCAVVHGWHEENLSDEHFLCLVISELMEAVEADRKGRHADTKKFNQEMDYYIHEMKLYGENYDKAYRDTFEYYLKDSVEDELSDACIRLLDLGMCIHQPYKDGVPKGKSYTHYMWNGKVYKSLEKLLDAMNQI